MKTMINKTNQFFTIMAFTGLIFNGEIYETIATSHYLVKTKELDFQSKELHDKILDIYKHNLILIIISNSAEKTLTFNIGDRNLNRFCLHIVPEREFFEKLWINDSLLNNSNINHTIFVFENFLYREIVFNLTMFKIMISGGSCCAHKKHILSLIQLRLARFIISLGEFSVNAVVILSHNDQSKEYINYINQEKELKLALQDKEKLLNIDEYNRKLSLIRKDNIQTEENSQIELLKIESFNNVFQDKAVALVQNIEKNFKKNKNLDMPSASRNNDSNYNITKKSILSFVFNIKFFYCRHKILLNLLIILFFILIDNYFHIIDKYFDIYNKYIYPYCSPYYKIIFWIVIIIPLLFSPLFLFIWWYINKHSKDEFSVPKYLPRFLKKYLYLI